MTDLVLYIGHDHREPDATAVCEHSARTYASRPLEVRHLEHLDLRRRQWFDRPWRINEDGSMTDERDGKFFSTQFSHTRFLAPLLARDEGFDGWALFVDADMVFMEDPFKILEEADNSKTVMVVPHNYSPDSKVKMDNQPQSCYNRKLWSAVMLWNLRAKKFPAVEAINEADGGFLHRFGWLADNDIGFLSESWQWVPNVSPTTKAALDLEANNQHTPINLVHMTLGIPGMENREPTPFDGIWRDHLITAIRNRF